jgi:hypothetical protein
MTFEDINIPLLVVVLLLVLMIVKYIKNLQSQSSDPKLGPTTKHSHPQDR